MNKKIISCTAAFFSAVLLMQSSLLPIKVSAENHTMPGEVDDVYDIGLGDATLVLKHYAMTSAGLESPLERSDQKMCADVNGDGYIDISDASAIVKYYAYNCSGLNIQGIFEVNDIEDKAYAAYKSIAADFLSSHSSDLDSDQGPAFDFAYIDSNFVPELILSPSTIHVSGGCTIYTYLNGKAVLLGEYCFGEFGEIKYCQGDGIIVNDQAYTGFRNISVQKLERGNLTETMHASINYLTNEATLNGKSSTESAVEAALPYTSTAGRSYTSIDQLWY